MLAKELIMVTTENNNKFYSMQEKGDGTFQVTFGRVGTEGQAKTYSMSEWNRIYDQKVRKGYRDVTDLRQQTDNGAAPDDGYKPIRNKSVAALVDTLMRKARGVVAKNYRVSAEAVTQQMVNEAQAILNRLSTICDVGEFNDLLLDLFQTIPRNMNHVDAYLAKNAEDCVEIVGREQALLDTMAGQVMTHAVRQRKDSDSDKTILAANGLKIKPATEEDKRLIRKHLGHNASRLDEAWVVVNDATQKRFDKRMKQKPIATKLLWHGSKTENWWSILCSGLKLRPTNAVITGKMFGYGIYFADSAQKSLNYTSLCGSYWASGKDSCGYMALMEVATGKPLDIYRHSVGDSSLDKSRLAKRDPNADSVFAHKGPSLRNNEIIVYDESQITIKYLVRLR